MALLLPDYISLSQPERHLSHRFAMQNHDVLCALVIDVPLMVGWKHRRRH
jgi:hypothetical protein